jgi:hypothetical protein
MSLWLVISVILGLLIISALGVIMGIIKKNKKLTVLAIIFLGVILTHSILVYFAIMSYSSGPQIPR